MQDNNITITHLIILIAVLFGLYFMINIKEQFEDTSATKSEKSSLQKAINDAYLNYTFGGVKFVR